MIRVERLEKNFGSFLALNELSFHVSKGCIHGFLGHNGAGKTTTLNILTGFCPYLKGSVQIDGIEVKGAKDQVQRKIGYLPEAPQFYEYMQAKELLTYLGRIQKWTKRESIHRAEELLDLVGLEDAAKRKVGGYSRGMKQRLGLACALVHDPELILLDEPTSALDPEGRRELLNLIQELKARGKTILISTHILSDVERVCNSVTMIKEGKCILDSDIETLKQIQGSTVYRIEFVRAVKEKELRLLRSASFVSEFSCQEALCFVKTPSEDPAVSLLLAQILTKLNLPFHAIQRQERTLEELYIRRMNGHD
ncbi:ABC transporter ATP-binding protein [Gottschalkiaceae bacterium SANA]|nr:ABC transporter ATP-binding protein [Gottschalkiaceae bacterium SANA]